MNHIANKKIVLDFYKKVVGGRDSDLIDNYVSDNYIQHSPFMKGGKAGLREAIEYLKLLPKPQEQKSPIVIAIAEGDYVMLLLDLVLMGKRLSVVDLFKVGDGLINEHWDAVREITGQNPAIPQFDLETREHGKSVSNAVQLFYEKRKESTLKERDEIQILRTIIEGDIAGVQSKGKKAGKPFVFYDFVEIENDSVLRFYGVEQEIPENLNHNNGML